MCTRCVNLPDGAHRLQSMRRWFVQYRSTATFTPCMPTDIDPLPRSPAGWCVRATNKHVNVGRKNLNLEQYSRRSARAKLEEIGHIGLTQLVSLCSTTASSSMFRTAVWHTIINRTRSSQSNHIYPIAASHEFLGNLSHWWVKHNVEVTMQTWEQCRKKDRL